MCSWQILSEGLIVQSEFQAVYGGHWFSILHATSKSVRNPNWDAHHSRSVLHIGIAALILFQNIDDLI